MTALTIVLVIAALLWARRRFALRTSAKSRAVVMVSAILALQVVIGAPAHAQSCNDAPNPERPGAGMVGALDPPVGNGLPGSPYLDYGYAGMVWHYHQANCSIVPNASATLDTWAGNELFSIGKNIVGATNALHYTVMGAACWFRWTTP